MSPSFACVLRAKKCDWSQNQPREVFYRQHSRYLSAVRHPIPGACFCAGANLKEITDGTMDGDDFQSMTNAIASPEMPSLAIVEGDVFGGAELYSL